MKTIVVATDYSLTANNALQFAAQLAREFKSQLVLLNVFHPSVHVRNSLVTPEAIDHINKNNEARLESLAQEVAAQYQIKTTSVSKTAETITALENYLATHEVDLLVMGMDSNLTEYKIFGNTTTAAIRRIKCPLLIVPNDIAFTDIKRILYACEHNFLKEDNHLDLLKEITRKFNAALKIFHVETRERLAPAMADEIKAMDAIMENVSHTYSFVRNPDVAEGIAREVKEWPADLLVMVPHEAGFWELFLKGSMTREMALTSRVPLLVLPNPS
jgi:nucleotide-binding universal stress UspA family protein